MKTFNLLFCLTIGLILLGNIGFIYAASTNQITGLVGLMYIGVYIPCAIVAANKKVIYKAAKW